VLCEEIKLPGEFRVEVVTKVVNNKTKFNRTKTKKIREIGV
jgi:hypothetical protein